VISTQKRRYLKESLRGHVNMLRYITRRIIFLFFIVIGVTVITFLILRLTPGNPVEVMAGPRATLESIQKIKTKFGLDKPVQVQYFYWLARTMQGDFGTSIITHQPASRMIGERLPATLILTATALLISLVVGIPMGVISAVKQYSIIDYIGTTSAFFWLSMPGFWLGLMLMLVFGFYLRWFPLSGYSGFSSLVLPALSLGLPQIGFMLRLARSGMLEVIREHYITAVRAKGMRERIVLYRHALRNAIIPIVVITFLGFPWLIGGAVVIETVFAWPGIGRLLYQAIIGKDFPIVQGIIFIIAVLTVLSNLIGDIIVAYLDPRIRY